MWETKPLLLHHGPTYVYIGPCPQKGRKVQCVQDTYCQSMFTRRVVRQPRYVQSECLRLALLALKRGWRGEVGGGGGGRCHNPTVYMNYIVLLFKREDGEPNGIEPRSSCPPAWCLTARPRLPGLWRQGIAHFDMAMSDT